MASEVVEHDPSWYDPGQPGDTSVLGWQIISPLKKGTGSELMPADAVKKRPWRGACPLFQQPLMALLVKGVQMDHDIIINGVVIDKSLDDSPRDGSFGEW